MAESRQKREPTTTWWRNTLAESREKKESWLPHEGILWRSLEKNKSWLPHDEWILWVNYIETETMATIKRNTKKERETSNDDIINSNKLAQYRHIKTSLLINHHFILLRSYENHFQPSLSWTTTKGIGIVCFHDNLTVISN